MLVDLHCHLTAPEFEKNLDEVLLRSRDMIAVSSGVNWEDNKKVLALCKKYKQVKAGLGLYPLDALKLNEEKFQRDLDFIRKHKDEFVYVGEAGLDYKESDNAKKQRDQFEKIISFVEKLKKPLLIHSRKAELDCVELLESSSVKTVIFHSFTGKLKLAQKIADLGWCFSIPTAVVKSEQFQKVVAEVDISQLFTETDAPFMSPHFGKRNEPSFVVEGVKKIAELKGLDGDEVVKMLYVNFQKKLL